MIEMANKDTEDLLKEAIKEAQEEANQAADSEEVEAEAKAEETEAEPETEKTSDEAEKEEEAFAEGEDEKESGIKGKFLHSKKKKENKDKERIEELEDKVKRQLAEFENFRTRSEREKAQMYDMGAKSVLEKILPVVDNFERGLMAVPENEECKPFADGMNMIYKQLLTELDNMGVKVIEAVGKEFDPNFHNAVMQVESEEYESGIIAQELQKGYTYRDTVIRHSMVAVVP